MIVVVPRSVHVTVAVKDAEIAVKVPARGTEKASLNKPDKSIVLPRTVGLRMLVPNPTNAGVLTNPPRILVKVTGTTPEANGMIEPVLALAGGIQPAATAVNGPTLQLSCPVSTRKQPELLR